MGVPYETKSDADIRTLATTEFSGDVIVDGKLGVGGNYGTEGQVLTSHGNSAPSWTTIGSGTPYHIVLLLGLSPNEQYFFRFPRSTWTTLNTLTIINNESANTTYNSDIVNNEEWRPSEAGIFIINAHVHFRGITNDSLTETVLRLEKWNGTSWFEYVISNDRRNLNSTDTDATMYTYHCVLNAVVNVTATDRFRFRALGNTRDNSDIVILAGSISDHTTKFSFTKIL